MQLTTELLTDMLFAETIRAQDQEFTMVKPLGTVSYKTDQDGNPIAAMPESDWLALAVAQHAAAVRKLKENFPALQIRYPQTVISEKETSVGKETQHFVTIRIDAVITAPESFVQEHTGTAFRQLLESEWTKQIGDLTEQIANRLRRHEFKTERMFGKDSNAAAVSFRITEDSAESDIWTILLKHCGFYPLQWDGEICGMALMLAERLKTALEADCGTLLETAVRRDAKQKCCVVTVYYSIKQD